MMKNSFVLAGAISLLVVFWLLSGLVTGGDKTSNGAAGTTPAEQAKEDSLINVRGQEIERQPYIRDIVISGRSEAIRNVAIRAQTDAPVQSVPVEKGERVQAGDIICQLEVNDRQANLDEARALQAQRDLEYRASRELADKGHRSDTDVAAARARLDAAIAMVERYTVELSHTAIRAPFEGIVDQRPAEVGDYLLMGDVCAHVLDDNPFLVVGEVSERVVNLISAGDEGEARLVDGSRIKGRVRYVSETASPETRTFRVELEVHDAGTQVENGHLRDGMTAEIRLPVAQTEAHLVSRSSLVLNDRGEVGVRVVEDETVRFYPIRILGDDDRGVWIDGLPETPFLITVGQAFVVDGQRVRATPEDRS